jgi:hypothetical protein
MIPRFRLCLAFSSSSFALDCVFIDSSEEDGGAADGVFDIKTLPLVVARCTFQLVLGELRGKGRCHTPIVPSVIHLKSRVKNRGLRVLASEKAVEQIQTST